MLAAVLGAIGKLLFSIVVARRWGHSLCLGVKPPGSRWRSGKEDFVTRLGLLVISLIAGAALAFAVAFTATSVLASSNESPVNQPLYQYGTK